MAVFSATIYKIGINPVVDPPVNVLDVIFKQAGREKGPIPVRGSINGAEYVQTLVKYSGKWQLYVNGQMLKDSGLKVGDTAHIEIDYDPQPRETPVPREFEIALASDEAAGAAFDSLTPSRRKEILNYLGHLKNEESLRRNIEKIIAQLAGRKVQKPHVAIRQ